MTRRLETGSTHRGPGQTLCAHFCRQRADEVTVRYKPPTKQHSDWSCAWALAPLHFEIFGSPGLMTMFCWMYYIFGGGGLEKVREQTPSARPVEDRNHFGKMAGREPDPWSRWTFGSSTAGHQFGARFAGCLLARENDSAIPWRARNIYGQQYLHPVLFASHWSL